MIFLIRCLILVLFFDSQLLYKDQVVTVLVGECGEDRHLVDGKNAMSRFCWHDWCTAR